MRRSKRTFSALPLIATTYISVEAIFFSLEMKINVLFTWLAKNMP